MRNLEKVEVNNADQFIGQTTVMVEPDGSTKWHGLTKREHFAGMAMQAQVASGRWRPDLPGLDASYAVAIADLLLTELAKERT